MKIFDDLPDWKMFFLVLVPKDQVVHFYLFFFHPAKKQTRCDDGDRVFLISSDHQKIHFYLVVIFQADCLLGPGTVCERHDHYFG